ncbi:MAG: TetR/AcrR family transcriptional regulator [Sphingomonadales bacterium]|nr:TetR/AcrR family transcriptional regulator [Sphingomonadales bacterium]
MPWEKQFDVEQVLGRAMQAFWANGYDATSMQDLVTATGVNRASLYATYGDKREIFLSALRKYDREVRASMLTALAKSDDPVGAIATVFDRFIAQTETEGGNWGCFLTNTALELAPHDAEVAGLVAAAQMEIEAFFRDMVARGQAMGRFPTTRSADELGRHLLASLLGLLVLIRSRPDPQFLKSIRDSALRLFE